ncbi:MAG: 3-deoxy-D-manno-octulosonic acid transferase [Caulobacteraceae bacterium]
MSLPPMLTAYRAATRLLQPLAPLLLQGRVRRGKEDAERLGERLGRASAARPDGPLVWVHGASVGESLSHLPLVERFARQRPDVTVLVTSGTRTSAELLGRRLPDGVIHQYAPVDTPAAAARFFDDWRPDLAVFVESELWPNLLLEAQARGVKLALMSARISAASARSWGRAPKSAGRLLSAFSVITAQDARTAEWIETFTSKAIPHLDLKRLAPPLPVDEAELARLRAAREGRAIVVAASTHAGEEVLAASVCDKLSPKPLLVIVPRHPERGEGVAASLSAKGVAVARRGADEPFSPHIDVYVADTLGELGLFYRLADVVVMGGSFVEGVGGHNPLEPARLDKAIVSGAHAFNFAATYHELAEARACLIAHDEMELQLAVEALLREPAIASALGERARAACQGEDAAFDAAWASLNALLPAP